MDNSKVRREIDGRLIEASGCRKGSILVDDDTYSWASKKKWGISQDGYVTGTITERVGRYRSVYLHRLIMGLDFGDKRTVDHMNGNKLDNRNGNLRIATQSQNCGNGKIRKFKKTSRFKGVYRNKYGWVAQITKDYKIKYIGRFETEVDAAKAYDICATKLFGGFAHLNFPMG
jgi:hypothetical protein